MAEIERGQGQFSELVSALGVVTARLPFHEMGAVLDSILSRMPEDAGALRKEIAQRYDLGDEARPYRRMWDYLSPPPGGS